MKFNLGITNENVGEKLSPVIENYAPEPIRPNKPTTTNVLLPFETKLYCRHQCQSKVSDFVDLLAGIVA